MKGTIAGGALRCHTIHSCPSRIPLRTPCSWRHHQLPSPGTSCQHLHIGCDVSPASAPRLLNLVCAASKTNTQQGPDSSPRERETSKANAPASAQAPAATTSSNRAQSAVDPSSRPSSNQRPSQHEPFPNPEDEEEDGFMVMDENDEYENLEDSWTAADDDELDGEGGEEEEEEEEGGGDDYAASFLEPDDVVREVVTGSSSWGETVLAAAREVLAQPALKGLELYLFRVLPAVRKVDIRLDKLDDLYGSPSIDDIERFQRGLIAALERSLGAEAAGEISFEVSSPGAERVVRIPDELERFASLPLKVEYRDNDGREACNVLLLDGLDVAAGSSSWRLANVRANARVKGRALSKKQLAAQISIRLSDIVVARIHVDF